ncbi:MAG TPA: ABC transporter ATP-binding protein [Candidatus Dormibacteraeota bacterium]|nr:ABC transporter ATP-binding protein [Candidatus Dormibacteraeota bacterium]
MSLGQGRESASATASSVGPVPGGSPRLQLEVTDLVKQYGGVRAVDGVSFGIQPQTITGIIGPNGAGKSTALGLISGFTPPTSGRIHYQGVDVTSAPMHRRARLGMVRTFQIARVFDGLTALENLVVAAPGQRSLTAMGLVAGHRYWRRQEEEIVERAHAMMESFGMADKANERAGTLSGGQRRAVEIMRALMMDPKLLLLDEPMAGLNPRLSRQLEDVFLSLREQGLTLILIEHELDTVERICAEVLVMAWGKVIAQGEMAELRTRREVQDAYVVG